MNAMNADRPQWAREDTSHNVNMSLDKNMSSTKLKLKPGHLSPSQKMPQQPPTARSERDPPSMYMYMHIIIFPTWGRRGRDRMLVGFTFTYSISVYHH